MMRQALGILLLLAVAGLLLAGCWVLPRLRQRGLDRWLPTYLATIGRRRRPRPDEPVHLLLCIADHYEPSWSQPDAATAAGRVRNWVEGYPRRFGPFRDSDGRPPRHTFFFPIDEYVPEHVEALMDLCHAGFGEVEIHHHHDQDTSEALRARLLDFRTRFIERHGALPVDRRTGAPAYAFVHGNWALDNARPDGRWCGVNDELTVLRQTGCYLDMTFPSFPSPTQPPTINSIYYAVDDPQRPRSHDHGTPIGQAPRPADSLMLIQGPLVLDWTRLKRGFLPTIENGCIQGNQPASIDRLDAWLRARVQVPSRPDWFFVKLHTHGAPEANQAVLLGEPMVRFHQALADRARANPNFHFHYVTAREMYNLARAAEAGWTGSVAEARDFELVWDRPRNPAGAAATRSGSEPAPDSTGVGQ